MDAALRRYKVMSYVTGTTLLLLCALLILHGLDVSAWRHLHSLDKIVGIGHGVVLYPIYMVMCFQIFIQSRGVLHAGLLVLMLLAGFVPGLAFYMERRIERRFAAASTDS
jgi:integral membrane protein